MVTYLSTVQAHSCLTSLIWPFTLTPFLALAGIVQVLAISRMDEQWTFFICKVSCNRIPNWLNFAQYKHEPKVLQSETKTQIELETG